jgi:hypothetical protein
VQVVFCAYRGLWDSKTGLRKDGFRAAAELRKQLFCGAHSDRPFLIKAKCSVCFWTQALSELNFGQPGSNYVGLITFATFVLFRAFVIARNSRDSCRNSFSCMEF